MPPDISRAISLSFSYHCCSFFRRNAGQIPSPTDDLDKNYRRTKHISYVTENKLYWIESVVYFIYFLPWTKIPPNWEESWGKHRGTWSPPSWGVSEWGWVHWRTDGSWARSGPATPYSQRSDTQEVHLLSVSDIAKKLAQMCYRVLRKCKLFFRIKMGLKKDITKEWLNA